MEKFMNEDQQCCPCDDPYSNVYHPNHYTFGNIECKNAIHAALGDEGYLAYCRGQIIKYSWRAGKKYSSPTDQDMMKAMFYAEEAANTARLISSKS